MKFGEQLVGYNNTKRPLAVVLCWGASIDAGPLKEAGLDPSGSYGFNWSDPETANCVLHQARHAVLHRRRGPARLPHRQGRVPRVSDTRALPGGARDHAGERALSAGSEPSGRLGVETPPLDGCTVARFGLAPRSVNK